MSSIEIAKAAKAAVYIRAAHADDNALGQQERFVVGFATDKGFANHTIYRDNGASGVTLIRPGMERLMNNIRSGEIDTVIVKDFVRIARGLPLLMEWQDFVQKHRAKVISVHDGDLDDCGSPLIWFREFLKAM